MGKLFSFCFLQLFAVLSLAQTVCKGKVTDSLNGKPVEFANIGVIGKGVGTVSNESGEYSLVIPDSLLKEPVRISVIGYRTRTLAVSKLLSEPNLKLGEETSKLNEVVVQAKKLKVKILGNSTRHKSVEAGFKKNSLGAEIAVPLNIKTKGTQLRKFMVNISSNTLDKAMFRLNIYKKDERGMPGENILQENIIIEPKEKTGFIELDLKPYGLYVDDDVFVSLEWIKDLGDVEGLRFSTKLAGTGTYFRQASQDKWEKITPFGVGLHVEVGY